MSFSFLGSSKSPHSHSKSAKSSKKGKSLAPSRSTRSIKVASEVELPRENIKIVLSRVNKGQARIAIQIGFGNCGLSFVYFLDRRPTKYIVTTG
jgi:hypothetical protein